jgi:hypothetical protein
MDPEAHVQALLEPLECHVDPEALEELEDQGGLNVGPQLERLECLVAQEDQGDLHVVKLLGHLGHRVDLEVQGVRGDQVVQMTDLVEVV